MRLSDQNINQYRTFYLILILCIVVQLTQLLIQDQKNIRFIVQQTANFASHIRFRSIIILRVFKNRFLQYNIYFSFRACFLHSRLWHHRHLYLNKSECQKRTLYVSSIYLLFRTHFNGFNYKSQPMFFFKSLLVVIFVVVTTNNKFKQ